MDPPRWLVKIKGHKEAALVAAVGLCRGKREKQKTSKNVSGGGGGSLKGFV